MKYKKEYYCIGVEVPYMTQELSEGLTNLSPKIYDLASDSFDLIDVNFKVFDLFNTNKLVSISLLGLYDENSGNTLQTIKDWKSFIELVTNKLEEYLSSLPIIYRLL